MKQVRVTEISNEAEEGKDLFYWAITEPPLPRAETVMQLIQYQ